jgi:hypothetical protein
MRRLACFIYLLNFKKKKPNGHFLKTNRKKLTGSSTEKRLPIVIPNASPSVS